MGFQPAKSHENTESTTGSIVAYWARACSVHTSQKPLHPGVDFEALVGQVVNLRPIGNRPVSLERTASSSRVSVARGAPEGIVFCSCERFLFRSLCEWQRAGQPPRPRC